MGTVVVGDAAGRGAWSDRLSYLGRGGALYVVALPVVAGALGVALLLSSGYGRDALPAGLVLLAASLCSVEASRWTDEPENPQVKDVLSIWWLAMAVLLPPVWALLAPSAALLYTQLRVRAAPLHRRAVSGAAVGLAFAAASAVFHAVFPAGLLPGTGPSAVHGVLRWAPVLGATGLGLAAAALNTALIAVAIKAVQPEVPWRALLLDPDNLGVDAVETCLGVVVAVCAATHAGLALFVLPPSLLLQRGLLHSELTAAAQLDAKTGLLNAVRWHQEAAVALGALHRRRRPAAVLLIDIDHFKKVNDTHGHVDGDLVLQAVARTLAAAVREDDLLSRFGGEEFTALLPDASAAQADAVAERVRQSVAALRVPLSGGARARVTVSVGVAVSTSAEAGLDELVSEADRCLYLAKAAGRDRVCRQGAAALHLDLDAAPSGVPPAPRAPREA